MRGSVETEMVPQSPQRALLVDQADGQHSSESADDRENRSKRQSKPFGPLSRQTEIPSACTSGKLNTDILAEGSLQRSVGGPTPHAHPLCSIAHDS